jgi:superfamily II helicase
MSRRGENSTLCPACGSVERTVLNTSKQHGVVYRRSECRNCSARYTTHERIIADQTPATTHALVRLLDSLTDIEQDIAALRATIDTALRLP